MVMFPIPGAGVKDAACIYCGEPLDAPHILWVGRTAELLVHAACALDFSLRLLRDVHEIECRLHLGAALTADAAR